MDFDQHFSSYNVRFEFDETPGPIVGLLTWAEVKTILTEAREDKNRDDLDKPWAFYADMVCIRANFRKNFSARQEGDSLVTTLGEVETIRPVIVEFCHDFARNHMNVAAPNRSEVDIYPGTFSYVEFFVALPEDLPSYEDELLEIALKELAEGCQHRGKVTEPAQSE